MKGTCLDRHVKIAFRLGPRADNLVPGQEGVDPLMWATCERHELSHGNRIPAKAGASGQARALSEEGDLVAIVEVDGDEWQPRKVFFVS